MSDETPELPPLSEETPDPKTKAVRKRAKVGPKKPEAPADIEAPATPPVPVPAETHIEERTETRTTDNGTVQRVSSKRVPGKPAEAPAGPSESARDDEHRSPSGPSPSAEETIPLVKEPPGPDNQGGSGKRRRRRRGKSGHDDPRDQPDQGPGQPQPQRSHLDPDKVAKKAWKIFLAEVSEEGLALIGDNDAKEVSRRSFRLAEIFLEEAARRDRSSD